MNARRRPVRRDAYPPDMRLSLVDDVPFRKLDLGAEVRRVAHDGEAAVGRPVRVDDVVRDLPRGASGNWRPGERSRETAVPHPGAQLQRKLAAARNRDERGALLAQARRFGLSRLGGVHVGRLPVPESSVVNCAPVRREPGGSHRSAAPGQPLETGEVCFSAAAREERDDSDNRDGSGAGDDRRDSPSTSPRSRLRPSRRDSGRLRETGNRLQGEREVAGGLESLARALLEAVRDDALESGRKLRPGGREVRRVGLQNRAHRLDGRVSGECSLPGEHLVEDRAERKNVAPLVDHRAPHLLRRHVADGSHHGAGLGLRRHRGRGSLRLLRPFDLRQPEVEDLHVPVREDEDVLRLEIAVNDALRVRGGQAPSDLQRDLDRLARRERSPFEPLREASRLRAAPSRRTRARSRFRSRGSPGCSGATAQRRPWPRARTGRACRGWRRRIRAAP